jgi:nucleoid DNA-binding protein
MSTHTKATGYLNHTGLVDAVAAESGVDRETVGRVLRATFDVVGRTVSAGLEVRVTNFGTWSRRMIRATRNPQTGETSGPSASVGFRPTGRLTEWVKSGQPSATLKKDRSH